MAYVAYTAVGIICSDNWKASRSLQEGRDKFCGWVDVGSGQGLIGDSHPCGTAQRRTNILTSDLETP